MLLMHRRAFVDPVVSNCINAAASVVPASCGPADDNAAEPSTVSH